MSEDQKSYLFKQTMVGMPDIPLETQIRLAKELVDRVQAAYLLHQDEKSLRRK